MKEYDYLIHLLGLGITAIVLLITLALSAWIFDAVMSSNMPDWLKYLILK